MPIYTRKGDDGTTGLLGKKRVKKTDPLFDALGTVDELNAQLGVCLSLLSQPKFKKIKQGITIVQDRLFSIGSNLAKPIEAKNVVVPSRPTQEDIDNLEHQIDLFDKKLKPLTNFILPGGHKAAAEIQLARAICRRAERRLFNVKTNPIHQKYINRLSDYLFTLSRMVNYLSRIKEPVWRP